MNFLKDEASWAGVLFHLREESKRNMPNIEEFVKERSFVTDRISTQVRLIAIGLLATTWSLLIGDINILKNIIKCFRSHFIMIGTIAIVTMTFDFLQYLFSYLAINKTLSRMGEEGLKESDYNYSDAFYKWSNYFFVLKQFLLLISITYFVVCMFIIFISI